MVIQNPKYNSYFLALCILIYSSCASNEPQNKSDKDLQALNAQFTAIYAKYPTFYPNVFDLDSNNKQTYFYDIFKEVKYIQDYKDSYSCRIFDGVDGALGRQYKIVFITYKNKTYTLPVDIETGDGVRMLNDALTPLWLSINKTQLGGRNAYIMDKIIKECLDFTPTHPVNLAKINTTPLIRNSRWEKLIENETRQFNACLNQIKDSAFVFDNLSGLNYNTTGKYLFYFDKYSQVFIVSFDTEKIQFKFYNPCHIRHFYY